MVLIRLDLVVPIIHIPPLNRTWPFLFDEKKKKKSWILDLMLLRLIDHEEEHPVALIDWHVDEFVVLARVMYVVRHCQSTNRRLPTTSKVVA